MKTEGAPITDGAAQDAAQDVIAVVVARQNSVGDGETQRADMVRDDAEGDVDFFLFGCAGDADSGRVDLYFLPLSFSILSNSGRKMSVS